MIKYLSMSVFILIILTIVFPLYCMLVIKYGEWIWGIIQ